MALDDKPKALDQAFIDGMRARIDVAMLIDKMQDHVRDAVTTPMRDSQIKVAIALLKKVIPDVQQTEIKGGQELGAAFAAAVRAANGVSHDPI